LRSWFEDLERRFPASPGGHLPEQLLAGDEATAVVPGPSSTLAAAELLRVWIEEVDHAEASIVV
jgi:hypothetical protein